MEENKEVYEVTHSSPEFKTVADYISDPSSPAFEYAKDMEAFLSVVHADGTTTNREAVEKTYKNLADKELIGKSADQLKLKIGTTLAIPKEKVNKIGLLTEGIEVVSNDIPTFKAKMLADLESEEGYRPVASYKPVEGRLQSGVTKDEYPNVTVWMWCRALSSNSLENEGQIFNITPFVQKVETNVSKEGGNFQLTLPPLVCELSEEGKWVIKKNSLQRYQSSKGASTNEGSYVAEGSFFKVAKDGSLKRNEFLFHNIISPNDMVWIRYETLELEKEQRVNDNKEFYINKDMLAGRIYDMIGLVDINRQSVDPTSNDVTIEITGRDLSKLFIEDGTYFYALEMSQGQLNFAGGSTQENSLMQRAFSNNMLQVFGLYHNNSIEKVLKFVIQQLSTIKVVPDSLFTSYGDRRNSKMFEQKDPRPSNNKSTTLEKEIRELIASIRKTAELIEESAQLEKKEIDRIWSLLVSFMEDIRTQKVRKVSGNRTVGWKAFTHNSEDIEEDMLPKYFHSNLHIGLYYTRAQVPKKDQSLLFSKIDKYLDTTTALPAPESKMEEDLAPGVWQIVKLVVDEGVTGRRIVDSSMSSANGSLLNFFKKVCQEPFVEFYMDTYGDTFHLIARKPPTDEVGMLSMLDGKYTTESGDNGAKSTTTSTVVDIEASDVLQEHLSYSEQGVSTWFHLTPQASLIGGASGYSLSYLPAIFLKEYAEIWGSRPMQLVHNYMPHIPLNPRKTELDLSEKQAFEDLKYMVESNAYVPFTRSGSLTVNGDRRLKRGNILRYKSTGEIFFIDHVQQHFSISESSIDRTTTVQVSRGMKEALIRGVASAGEMGGLSRFSYFDIVGTDLTISKSNPKIKTEKKMVWVRDERRVVSESPGISNLFQNANKFKGYKYQLGSTGENHRIDCSGFVTRVLQLSDVNVSRAASEELMTRSNGFREVPFIDYTTLRPGDVVGLDASSASDHKTYGIDHIAIVVKNMDTGKLELAESVSKVGVRSTPLEEVIPRYNRISKRKYLGSYRNLEVEKEEIVPIYEERDVVTRESSLERGKIFSNFKVQRDCFNFFLRRRMNDDSLKTNILEDIIVRPK